MPLLRMLLVVALLAGSGLGLVACKDDGGYAPPSQDWPPRRTAGGHD